MLPPPTTAATWTPSFVAAMISAARWATTSGEMPRGSEPANSPPDSFSSTRRQLGCTAPGPDSGMALGSRAQAWPTWNLAKPVTVRLPVARTCLMVALLSFTKACSVSTTSLK